MQDFRFDQGARCWALIDKGQPVACLWFASNRFEEDEVRACYTLDRQGKLLWDFGVQVIPSRRLGRAFSRLWAAACQEMYPKGARWTLSRISKFNAASVRSHARLGARSLGWAVFYVLGPVQLCITDIGFPIRLSGPSGLAKFDFTAGRLGRRLTDKNDQ